MKSYLSSSILQFKYYKTLGEKTITRIPDNKLSFKLNDNSNSINTIVKHLSGNMLSRWTNFLNSDGEKDFRERDNEFVDDINNKEELLNLWSKGWDCLFNTLESLSESDLEKIVYIRNESHTVIESINRQLCHYSYHIGQIVYLGKIILEENWESLSIPKGQSEEFNSKKFSIKKK